MNDARKAICGRDPPRALNRTRQAWRRVAKGGSNKHAVSVKSATTVESKGSRYAEI